MIKKSRCAKCATKGLGAETTTSQGNIEVNPSYLRVKAVELLGGKGGRHIIPPRCVGQDKTRTKIQEGERHV